MRVKGAWKYLYRAVEKAGARVDFLLTAKRDRKAALRFLCKATCHHGDPEKITIGKSGANTAAIESYNCELASNIGSDLNLMKLGRRLALNPKRNQPDVANPSSFYDCAAWISR